MTDQHTITVQDTLSRHWTIVTEPAVVGFRWRVYVHHDPSLSADTLEAMHPGGAAWGWTDDDRTEESARAWLDATMRIKDAVEQARCGVPLMTRLDTDDWSKERRRQR